MSSIDECSLTHDDASLLLECGSFWPDSMVDKGSFLKMFAHALKVEAHDIQSEPWEEKLTASGACNAFGVVDVKQFVEFCLRGGVQRAETMLPGQLLSPQLEDERLAAPDPSTEMLAATKTNPSNPLGRDLDWESWTLSTAVIG
eukprot:3802037-Amphidinium_carterae.1